jgi:TrmH family RNA methyltransferase
MPFREISSLQHPLVKHLVKLRENREYRYSEKKIIISGIKLIKELSRHCRFRTLLVSGECCYQADEVVQAPMAVLKKITGLENPEPIAAELDMPPEADLLKVKHLLILDGVSDPGNLGTLLRTARGLGWDGAFLTTGSTDPYNEKALRAAKGATFTLPWRSGTVDQLLDLLRKERIPLIAADVDGEPIESVGDSESVALALGNEAHGLSAKIREMARAVCIPMQGRIESLNVGAAGAILMYLLRSQ